MGTLNFFLTGSPCDPDSMANILSLRDVYNLPGVRLTMDSLHFKTINVHLPSGLSYTFLEGDNGLYFYDTTKPHNHIKPTITAYSLLTTVADNKKHISHAKSKERRQVVVFRSAWGGRVLNPTIRKY